MASSYTLTLTPGPHNEDFDLGGMKSEVCRCTSQIMCPTCPFHLTGPGACPPGWLVCLDWLSNANRGSILLPLGITCRPHGVMHHAWPHLAASDCPHHRVAMLPADGGATGGKGMLENGDRRWSTASSAEFGIARAYKATPASSSMLSDDELLPTDVSAADQEPAWEPVLPTAVAISNMLVEYDLLPMNACAAKLVHTELQQWLLHIRAGVLTGKNLMPKLGLRCEWRGTSAACRCGLSSDVSAALCMPCSVQLVEP